MMRRGSSKPARAAQPTFFQGLHVFLTIATFVIATVALIMGAIGIYKGNDTEFKGLTHFEAVPLIGEPSEYKSTFAVPCTNKTYGSNDRSFFGETYLGYRCPEPSNPCAESVCGSDGQCREQTISGGQCHENGDCFNGKDYYCDWSTCQCEALFIESACATDSDCEEIDWTTCLQYYCDNGKCSQNFTAGSECAVDDNCAPGSTCQNCTCVASTQCTAASECPTLLNTCSEYDCVAGQCTEVLAMGAGCYSDEQCVQANGNGFSCNITSCACYATPAVTCAVDADCPTLLDTCSEYACVAGTCVEQLAMGATCSSDEQCVQANGNGFSCNITSCACYATPAVTCTVDADCPTLLDTCSEYACMAGTCVEQLAMGATCSSDEQCVQSSGAGYACNITTCACYLAPSAVCQLDSDCQAVSWSSCIDATCVMGQCIENLAMGATCATSGDCAAGEFCRGCACVSEIGALTSFTPVITYPTPNEFAGASSSSGRYQIIGDMVYAWLIVTGTSEGLDPADGYRFNINVPVGTINSYIGGVGTLGGISYNGNYAITYAGSLITFTGRVYALASSEVVRSQIFFVYDLA